MARHDFIIPKGQTRSRAMDSRMIKIAGRCAAFAAACLALCSAQAANRYWTGAGGDNEWGTAANWSGAAMPGSGDTVVFTNDAPLSLQVNVGGYPGAARYRFIGKDVSIGSVESSRRTLYIYGTSTCAVEVVEGTTVTISNNISMYNADNKGLAKTGKGTFRFVGRAGYTTSINNATELIVEEGEFGGMPSSGDYGVYLTVPTNITVKSGATLFMAGYNALNEDHTVIYLESNATFRVDTRGSQDFIAGISGAGAIVTPASKTANLKLSFKKGPCEFSGTTDSRVTLEFLNYSAVDSSNKRFVVGGVNSLASATVKDNAGALRFAPGLGECKIGTYTLADFKELRLEDEAGEPVSLTAKFSSTAKTTFTGAGSLHVVNSGATFTNDQMQIGGTLSIGSGQTMTFGNGTAEADVDLSTIAGLGTAGGTLAFKNVGTTVLDVPVEGNGTIKAYGSVYFSDFRMADTQIEPSAAAIVTLAGGDSTLSSFTFAEANATIEVTGGTHTGKKTLRTLDTASVLPVPSFIPTAYRPGMLRVSGGEVWLSNAIGELNRLELLGGNCVAAGGYAANSAATAENPSVILFDGGTMTISMRDAQYWWWMPNSASSKTAIKIGAKGARFGTRDRSCGYNPDSADIAFQKSMSTADGVASDGGVTFDLRRAGFTVVLLEPLLVNGPVTAMDGRISVFRYSTSQYAHLDDYPSFFGTGDFTLDCSVLAYLKAGSAQDVPEGTLRLASGAGSRFTVRGASAIRFRTDSGKPQQHVVAGADGAASCSAFVCERGGAFYIYDGGHALDGTKSTFVVNGGVATNEHTTLVRAPVFGNNTSHSGSGDDCFLCYDGEKGFVEFTDYKTSLTAGENAVVRASNSSSLSLAANANAHVAAVQLVNWGTMTLNAGSRLTVGNGVDPACVLMGYETDINGSGTLDFGTSEGVISVGPAYYDEGHLLKCSIAGSGGVTYAGMPNYQMRLITISGASTYTGGTHISGSALRVRNARAFSTGDVYLDGGYRNGGKLLFDRPMTFSNNLHVSGGGHRLHQEWQTGKDFHGAIAFLTNDVTIAGNVDLVAYTEMSSLGEGTFTGTISGDRLVAKPGAGRIVLAADNTYTGGTEIVRTTIALAGAAPSLGTGMVSLDNGVLRFENTAPIVFTNELDGVGRIEVAGAAVTFASPGLDGLEFKKLAAGASFDYPGITNPVYVVAVDAGGMDLGGRDATVAGVSGSGRVSGGVLTITGEINPGGAGSLGTLAFERTPVFSGATYVCDVSGTAADRLVFEDDVDVSALAFRAVRSGSFRGQNVEAVASDGEVTGTFASAAFPRSSYSLSYGEKSIKISNACGLILCVW